MRIANSQYIVSVKADEMGSDDDVYANLVVAEAEDLEALEDLRIVKNNSYSRSMGWTLASKSSSRASYLLSSLQVIV